jgi:KUP system potassium uptake protein
MVIDGLYFASNVTKIPDGGWFPLLVAAVAFTVLTTWRTGRKLVRERLAEGAMPVALFIKSAAASLERVSGTAVFLASTPDAIPPALLHNVKHNRVLHERVVILTVVTEQIPHVRDGFTTEVAPLGSGFYRVIVRHGFMDDVDIPATLATITSCGEPFKPMDTSFFLARQTLIASSRPGMALWREKLFAWMVRNAESAMEFFKLPTNRVVELGSQLEI